MNSPELAELCQALLEFLRAAVAANQDQEVGPVQAGGAAAAREEALKPTGIEAPQVQGEPFHST
jgi:hypothetical protein